MHVWIDIYTERLAEKYQWRVVIDTSRNLFTVLDTTNSKVVHSDKAVSLHSGDIYAVCDSLFNTTVGPCGNCSFIVQEAFMKKIITILPSGVGTHTHVVWANGHNVATKPWGEPWLDYSKTQNVSPLKIIRLPRLLLYRSRMTTPIYKF